MAFKACRRAIKFNDHLEEAMAADGSRGDPQDGKKCFHDIPMGSNGNTNGFQISSMGQQPQSGSTDSCMTGTDGTAHEGAQQM